MEEIENTLENKARFYALYWGQKVAMCYNSAKDIQAFGCLTNTSSEGIEILYLELTPLSHISDEDAMVIGIYRYSNPKSLTYQSIGKGIVDDFLIRRDGKGSFELELFEIDFLRKKGYALPFENLSVDDLVSYGWIKLKEANHG